MTLKSNGRDDRNRSASSSSITELIKLYPNALKSEAQVAGIDYKSYLFFALVHEIIHSQSFTVVQGAKEFYGTGGFWSNLIRVLKNADLGSTVIEKSGLDKSVVWDAIKRRKFGVENTNDDETLHILNETITPTLYNQLKR